MGKKSGRKYRPFSETDENGRPISKATVLTNPNIKLAVAANIDASISTPSDSVASKTIIKNANDYVELQKNDEKKSDDKAVDSKSGGDWSSSADSSYGKRKNYDESTEKRNKADRGDSGSKSYEKKGKQGSKFNDYEKKKTLNEDLKEMKFEEVNGDLFDAPDNYSLAHCVAEDLSMNAGIAIEFKKRFKKYGDLMDQNKKTGEVAILEHNKRFVYYLVTKRLSRGKPTIGSLKSSLTQMRDHVITHDVKQIAMPRIGCGLDLLDWDEVKMAIREIFGHLDLHIVVYNLVKDDDDNKPRPKFGFVKYKNHHIFDLDPRGTTFIYLASESNEVSEEMKMLDSKHRFLSELTNKNQLGEVLITDKGRICGLVCKDKNDHLSFKALEECLKKINNKEIGYIGLEVDRQIVKDVVMLKKFECLLRSALYPSTEIHLCSTDFSEDVLFKEHQRSKQTNFNRY